jgi:hypothetical protein
MKSISLNIFVTAVLSKSNAWTNSFTLSPYEQKYQARRASISNTGFHSYHNLYARLVRMYGCSIVAASKEAA